MIFTNDGDTNAILAIEPGYPETKNMPVYYKRHLVPFGEYTPFREILPDFIEKMVSISSSRDFANGKKANLLQTKQLKIGALICYEAIFPYMSRELVNQGAEILVNGSNLGWYHNSIIDQQFISMCVFRAVENNRYFLVAINNGSSAIISPYGEILKLTERNTNSFVSAKITPVKNKTFYTQWGI